MDKSSEETKLKFVKTHIPCPSECGMSTDAYCIREDGSGYCFGQCGGRNFNKNQVHEEETDIEYEYKHDLIETNLESKIHPHRGLSENTLSFYGIKTKFLNDIPLEVGFPYPQFTKIRNYDKKEYRTVGQAKDPDLFGMDKFDPGSKKSITITAGEYDAPSIYQVTGGQTAAVSLPSGGKVQAVKICAKHRDYINSFKKIYLALDNDQGDQETTRAISQLFDFNKVYLVKFNKYKDANDYLQNHDGVNLFNVWDGAKRYSPDNIISSFGDIKSALDDESEELVGTWPFSTLNSHTYGIFAGECSLVFAVPDKQGASASGVGKTEFFRACEHHLLKTTKHNIGIIHLEEGRKTTIKAIAGYELGLPAVLPDSGLSKNDIFDGYRKAVSDDDSRVHIFSSFDLQDEDGFLDSIRFLGAGAKCRIIFLDHITWLATGLEQDDTTKKLDRLSQKLKLLAKELNIHIVLISHVNDDGRTRGSRNIENVTATHIRLKRDKDSQDETIRNTVYIDLPKVRLGGQTGPAGYAIMNQSTRRLEEPKLTDEYRIPL